MAKKWTVISDDKVRHIWKCENEDCDVGDPSTEIEPSYYTNNGTPVCDCGEDMVYIRTEILK